MKIRIPIQIWATTLCLIALTSFKPATCLQKSADPIWELQGTRKIDYRLEVDEFPMTGREGIFTGFKLRVRRSPINLFKIAIYYSTGEIQEMEAVYNLAAGGETGAFELPGNQRVIRKVVFSYGTKNLASRKAILELWGRK